MILCHMEVIKFSNSSRKCNMSKNDKMMYCFNNRLRARRVHNGPDEQHEARCSPERDDEGAEDGQSQEVREDSVAAVSAWTLAQSGRQVAWSGISRCYTPAIVKHLTTKKTLNLSTTNELQQNRKQLSCR